MATKVILPKQGLQMTEGTITKWLVAEGGRVEEGKPLFEMETDKLTIQIDAPATGVLLKILKGEGETVPITEMIAVIGEPGEDISALLREAFPGGRPVESRKPAEVAPAPVSAEEQKGKRRLATPRAETLAGEKGIDLSAVNGTGPDGLVIERDVLNARATEPAAVKATPLAIKTAQLCSVDLGLVTGTGARGKITRADVEAAASEKCSEVPDNGERLVAFSGMRKIIAGRMMQSLHGMAQANHRMRADMTRVVELRENLKADGVKVSYTDILVKITARALTKFPVLNSSFTEGGMLLHGHVNMGVAVALDDGLIVPNIKSAETMALAQISEESAKLVEKARSGGLEPDDCAGGTFTLTNLGMFDIDEFTAIINPPESAILAVGKIMDTPVAEEGAVVIRPVMTLSLTYDHRLADGATAARFLQSIKKYISDPYLLL